MSYLERIQNDLTAAMKEKNELRLSVLRMMKSALKLKEVEKMKPLDDLESLQILQTPTILVISPSGKTKTLTGLADAYAIRQAIKEARKP